MMVNYKQVPINELMAALDDRISQVELISNVDGVEVYQVIEIRETISSRGKLKNMAVYYVGIDRGAKEAACNCMDNFYWGKLCKHIAQVLFCFGLGPKAVTAEQQTKSQEVLLQDVVKGMRPARTAQVTKDLEELKRRYHDGVTLKEWYLR